MFGTQQIFTPTDEANVSRDFATFIARFLTQTTAGIINTFIVGSATSTWTYAKNGNTLHWRCDLFVYASAQLFDQRGVTRYARTLIG